MTDHPGEQFPPEVDPDVEPGADPRTEDEPEPDYDSEPGPESRWVNPTLQGRPHTDPLLAGFTVYGDPTPAVADDPVESEDTESTFEASLQEEALTPFQAQMQAAFGSGSEDADEAERPEVFEDADHGQPFEEATPEVLEDADHRESFEAASAQVSEDADQRQPFEAEEAEQAETQVAPAALPVARAPVPTPGQAFPSPASFPKPGPAVSAAGHAAAAPAAPAPAAPATAAPASGPAVSSPFPAAEAARDGSRYEVDEDGVHPLVDEVMGRLDGLRERPVGEHAEVYADLHERLQSALVEADAEHGGRG
ncbi:hypothetical protein GCM10009789_58930 [Kribbella sancticallisti]|uniref:Uncharacterized protein n=1 Tax=Kribbella sancticallisti TaxID=460087 RepID=A0ABN2E5T2_9ACTN